MRAGGRLNRMRTDYFERNAASTRNGLLASAWAALRRSGFMCGVSRGEKNACECDKLLRGGFIEYLKEDMRSIAIIKSFGWGR